MEFLDFASNPLNWLFLVGTFGSFLSLSILAFRYIVNKQYTKLINLAHQESLKLVHTTATNSQKRQMVTAILRSAAPPWLDPFISDEKLKYFSETGYKLLTKPMVKEMLESSGIASSKPINVEEEIRRLDPSDRSRGSGELEEVS